MATLPMLSYPHISTRPEVVSGSPCIAGKRVRVMDVIATRRAGVTDDEITYTMKQGYVVLSSNERALWRPQHHREPR